jgi:hypothetical protein
MFNTLIIDVYIRFSLTSLGLFVVMLNTLIIDVYIGFSLT